MLPLPPPPPPLLLLPLPPLPPPLLLLPLPPPPPPPPPPLLLHLYSTEVVCLKDVGSWFSASQPLSDRKRGRGTRAWTRTRH